MIEVTTEDRAFFGIPASADSEEHPASGKVVQSRDLLGE